MAATVMLRMVDGKLSPVRETPEERAENGETDAVRVHNLEQAFALIDYRDVVCHGDLATLERSLAYGFITGPQTSEEIDEIVDARIAYSQSRPDGRSAPLRFDDLNTEIRKIRELVERA